MTLLSVPPRNAMTDRERRRQSLRPLAATAVGCSLLSDKCHAKLSATPPTQVVRMHLCRDTGRLPTPADRSRIAACRVGRALV